MCVFPSDLGDFQKFCSYFDAILLTDIYLISIDIDV